MKKMAKWKKVLLIIITVIVALRIVYIAFRGEVDKEYYVSAQYDLSAAAVMPCQNLSQTFTGTGNRLNSLELVFSDITEDKAGAIDLRIYTGDDLIYRTGISLANINNEEWKKIYVNAELDSDKEYRITLNSNNTCTQIPNLLVVSDNYAPEIIASYADDDVIPGGQLAINYGYLRYPSWLDRSVMISLWVLFWIAIFALLYYFEVVKETINIAKNALFKQVKPQTAMLVLQMAACSIIINSSGIEFQFPTKVILYVTSLISIINYSVKKDYVDNLINNSGGKRTLVYLLYIYAAFALVGQRILIYPLTLKLTIAGGFVFFCTVVWFIPIVQSALYYLEVLSEKIFISDLKIKTWKFIVICVLLLIIPAAYNLYAFNPGITSSDTVANMITNARQLYGIFDYQPAFYAMVLRVIETVWNSTYAVILVQYFFWAYVVTELMLYLRKKEIKESVLIMITLFSGLNAANYIQINTIWKDIPYTLSLLWALIIVAKLTIDFEEYRSKWYIYLELITALVGTCLYRKNGMVSFIIIAVPLALVLRKNMKLLCSLALSTLLIFTIKGPIYDYFRVEDSGHAGMYIGLSQDILGVYYAGGEVSEETLKMINVMTYHNNAEYSYTPTRARQSYALDVEVGEFIFNYIDTFLKNPITMIRAVVDRQDLLWDIYLGMDSIVTCVNLTGTMDEDPDWSAYYPARKYVSLYDAASAASAYTADSQWISAIEWRCGLFTLLGLISIVFLLVKKEIKKYLLIVTPAIGQVMSLILSTGWSEFRYFWPMNLLNMTIILLVIVISRSNGERPVRG